jgi:phospholipid transport system substrate-binding protein
MYALPIDEIKLKFEVMTKEIFSIVQLREENKDVRNLAINKIIIPIFDFKLMARLSLGKVWKTLDEEKQSEFIILYVKRMKKLYSEKVDKYTDEKIIINNIKQTKQTRVILNTSLISSDAKIEIIYKYHKPKKRIKNKNLWLVYDVIMDGVSIIKTDKAQFRAVLKEHTMDELMEKLRK